MIVGNGQLAQTFQKISHQDIVVFASGVSNSSCQEEREFQREETLLLSTLEKHKDKKFIYFSSCALSADAYELNEYYRHKQRMENLIKQYSNNYYIFRIPQLFGDLKKHKTIINYFYNCIINQVPFSVYNDAYRYVIELNDLCKIVDYIVSTQSSKLILDIANPYRYKIINIVEILENLLSIKANYKTLKKTDKYILDFDYFNQVVDINKIGIENFGEEYLYMKLKEKVLGSKS